MNISKILSFLLEHIDVIISAVIGLLGGMQIEKIIIKNLTISDGWNENVSVR